MDNSLESAPDKRGKTDMGEVPEKQLHRWKGEGGALPPEPGPDIENDPEAGSGAESRPEADDS